MCRGQRGPQGSLRQGGSTSAGLHMDIDIVTDNHIVDIVLILKQRYFRYCDYCSRLVFGLLQVLQGIFLPPCDNNCHVGESGGDSGNGDVHDGVSDGGGGDW